MSCPYSAEVLERWEDVANPMGRACDHCMDCECIHWDGNCVECDREDCPDPDRALFQLEQMEDIPTSSLG